MKTYIVGQKVHVESDLADFCGEVTELWADCITVKFENSEGVEFEFPFDNNGDEIGTNFNHRWYKYAVGCIYHQSPDESRRTKRRKASRSETTAN
jgi:hypothetical protein